MQRFPNSNVNTDLDNLQIEQNNRQANIFLYKEENHVLFYIDIFETSNGLNQLYYWISVSPYVLNQILLSVLETQP